MIDPKQRKAVKLSHRWTAAVVVSAAVLSAPGAAHAQGVTNPADHPFPISVTIDGQTYTDGRDTLPGYDDQACTPIPYVSYDFASNAVLYYDSDGQLLKTAKWSEWSRISSYQAWLDDQKTPTPTATPTATSQATSTPSPSSGGSSNTSTTTTTTTTPGASSTGTTTTTTSTGTSGKSQTTKSSSGKSTTKSSSTKTQSTKSSSSSSSSGTKSSTTKSPSTSTSSTTSSTSASSSSGAAARSSSGGSSSSSSGASSAPQGGADADPALVTPGAPDTGATEQPADGTAPVAGAPESVDTGGGVVVAANGAPAGTPGAAGNASPVAAVADTTKYQLASQAVDHVGDTRLAGIGILVALVAAGFFCLAFTEVRAQLFGRRRNN